MARNTDSYGSARWANAADLASEGLFTFNGFEHDSNQFRNNSDRRRYIASSPQKRALLVGTLANPAEMMQGIREGYDSSMSSLMDGLVSLFKKNHHGEYLGWTGDGHVITVAPTRSGKGVGLVVPNLLHYPGSVIVIDPKGENYAITAEYRRNVLKQEIVCLDPFHVMTEHTDSINPLDGLVKNHTAPSTYLTQNPELADIAANIAEAIIMRDVGSKDSHWDDKARTFLKGIILAVICGKGPRKMRHLSEVRELIAQPFVKLEDFLYDVMRADATSAGGALQRAANEILSCGSNELKSIISSALKHTEFLDSELMCAALGDKSDGGRGTYDLKNLKQYGGVSIYMIIPPHHLTRYVRAIRLWVTMAMAAMTRYPGKPADGCPVLFMLDEMAQLGTMEMMRQAVSLLAGYGMSVWMVWQDLSQMKALYEHDWPTFLANAKIQQFFGINDHETAKYISEMLGAATIQTSSVSQSKNYQQGALWESRSGSSQSVSSQEMSRNLLNPDEVRRLNRLAVLTFVQGIPPIIAKRITYFQDDMFMRRAANNPYYNFSK